MSPDWITTAEAVELSGYHVNHIRRLIRRGHIDAQKFGPVWQISRSSLIRYIRKAESSKDKRWGPKT
jgi:excisionase family DNA binding protein